MLCQFQLRSSSVRRLKAPSLLPLASCARKHLKHEDDARGELSRSRKHHDGCRAKMRSTAFNGSQRVRRRNNRGGAAHHHVCCREASVESGGTTRRTLVVSSSRYLRAPLHGQPHEHDDAAPRGSEKSQRSARGVNWGCTKSVLVGLWEVQGRSRSRWSVCRSSRRGNWCAGWGEGGSGDGCGVGGEVDGAYSCGSCSIAVGNAPTPSGDMSPGSSSTTCCRGGQL